MMKTAVLFLFALIALYAGCSNNSEVLIGGVETDSSTRLAMSYDKFTGYRETVVRVNNDSPVLVRVDILTESGSLDAFIALDNDADNRMYEGNGIPTTSFTVNLKGPGQCTLRVEAKSHSGSYSFSWD